MAHACPTEDSLSALADAELSADASAAVLAHCAICPQCAARLDELRALQLAFTALPPLAPAVDLSAQIIARIQAEQRRSAAPAQIPLQAGWRQRLRAFLQGLENWATGPLPYAGSAAAIITGLWLGGMLPQIDNAPGRSIPNGMMVAMSVFDSVPPGNLCPPASNCTAFGNAR